MKISIDMDGTLWQHQDFFRAFMKAMQKDGHQVGILTSHSHKIESGDRRLMQGRGFTEPDFFLNRKDDSEHGAPFKIRTIKEQGIDYHFDDFDFGASTSMGEHPRIFRVWFEKPEGTHINKPGLPE